MEEGEQGRWSPLARSLPHPPTRPRYDSDPKSPPTSPRLPPLLLLHPLPPPPLPPRKSSSLAPSTRKRLVAAVCQAVQTLSSILSPGKQQQQQQQPQGGGGVVAQSFRDAYACHLYMLFSIMHFTESEAKITKSLGGGTGAPAAPGQRRKKPTAREVEQRAEAAELAASRAACASAMLGAAEAMAAGRSRLWRRGVADEGVVNLPCRIAYQMLEGCTGALARKACSGDAALGMIAASVGGSGGEGGGEGGGPSSSSSSLLGTAVAALVDLLHSYEHAAPLVAELCCLVPERPTNRLAVELLREVGRLDAGAAAGPDGGAGPTAASAALGAKASGVRYVAPFLSELASRRPRLVLAHISLVLPHLDSEPYQLRSSIVAAIGNILTRVGQEGAGWDQDQDQDQDQEQGVSQGEGEDDGEEKEEEEKEEEEKGRASRRE